MPHQSVTTLVQTLLCFPLCLLLSIFPSITTFCLPFPHTKCRKYCSFHSCIVLRSVCFALAICNTSILVFMSRCNILNTCQKIHISEALILSSICLTSVYDSEAYKKQESTLKSSVKPKKQAQEGFCAKKGGTINTFRLGEQYILFRCGNNIYFSGGERGRIS